MLRYLSPILQLFLFLLTFLFTFVCYQEWVRYEPLIAGGWCGTVSPIEYVPEGLSEEYKLGETIFRNNCAACHASDMKTNLTGPALGGSLERWEAYGGEEALYAWIQNSQQMIQEGQNLRAQQLWEEWGPTIMNSFINLTDEEIAAVMLYVEAIYSDGGAYISSNSVE
ncbi:MAG: cytochrome c [Bacteroidota bacterium]